MAEDIGGHLRVPVTGLVTEVHTCFQHFTHEGHIKISKGWVLRHASAERAISAAVATAFAIPDPLGHDT